MGDAALAQKTCPTCLGTFDTEAVFCPRDGAKLLPEGEELGPDSDPYIGTVISGDIELRTVAGAGAMGRVYRAYQRGIDRDVAVKVLHRELSGNQQLVQRFHREAKIASKLQHPHVVEVYMAGQLPDRALYIVMEYLDGMSLAAALAASGGALPLDRALTIALQICDAVGEGHARGIVHRDLKPENVMLVRRAEVGDWVKVLDFGIAKVNIGEQSMETQAGLIFGTARYISPEGAMGATVGPPGDVYSLAVMFYQMLTGHTPFDAEQPVGLLIKHIHETPPPLESFPAGRAVPEQLRRVVMDNLAKEPTKRASSARAFATALMSAAKEANVSYSDVGVVARMSNVDLGLAARYSVTVEPTLDDAAAMNAHLLPRAISSNPAIDRTEASLPPPQVVVTAAPTPAPPPHLVSGAPPEKRRSPLLLVAVAFLLGAVLAVLLTQHLLVPKQDDDRVAHVAKVRRALADSRYTSPPKDNVRDLVSDGLKRWPNDPDLALLRSETAHEMVTLSMAARTGGDVGGALGLAKAAIELDETDQSARMLVAQYEHELSSLTSTATPYSGPPKILFEAKNLARPGERVELVGRLVVGGAGPKAKVEGTRITLFANKTTTAGTNVPIASTDPLVIRASVVAPRPGSYDIVLETVVDGTPLRALRDLDVVK